MTEFVKDIRLMNPIEKARYFKKTLEDTGITQAGLAKQYKSSQAEIANTVRLLELPETVRNMIIATDISESAGRALLQLKDKPDILISMAKRTAEEKLTIKALDNEIHLLIAGVENKSDVTGQQNASQSNSPINWQLVTITPDQARKWFMQRDHNRKLNIKHVDYLADEMKSGRWQITHQGIAFGENSKLIDGQHRLSAIIKIGIPVTMWVANNVPLHTFMELDENLKRTNSFITGISKYYIEIYTFLFSLTYGNTIKPSPGKITNIHEYLHETVDVVKMCCDKKSAYFSSAPVKSAAVLTYFQSQERSKQYITDVYMSLVNGDLGIISKSPIVEHFYKSHFNNLQNKVSENRTETYTKAMYMFDIANKDKTKFYNMDKRLYLSIAVDITKRSLGLNIKTIQ